MANQPNSWLEDILRALADPTRRAVVERLAAGSCTVKALAKPFKMSLPSFSKHLKVLETTGLVERKVEGRFHHLSLSPEALERAAVWLSGLAASASREQVASSIAPEAARPTLQASGGPASGEADLPAAPRALPGRANALARGHASMLLPQRYAARRPLGRGTTSEVHLVFDLEQSVELALKRLAPLGESNPLAAQTRFRQRHWALQKLCHPNLVATHDAGTLSDGTPFFTLDFVPGQTLDLLPGVMEESAVRAWLPGVLRALSHLHEAGIVHGALAPSHLRRRPDGEVILMTPGLLRPTGKVAPPSHGSVLYLAPEIIRGDTVDGRADLYALGAVLYQLLAGRPPFSAVFGAKAGWVLPLLRAHLGQMPPPLRQEGISSELATLVMQMLAKAPGDRPQGAAEILTQLGQPSEPFRPSGLAGSSLIGRDRELAAINEFIAGPEPYCCLVGPPGAGRSHFLARLRAGLLLAERLVIAVAGLGYDAPPYEAWRAPLGTLLLAAPASAREAAAPVLATLWPLVGVIPARPLAGEAAQARLYTAIARLAAAVAPGSVWLIDDIDELDAASLGLLKHLQQHAIEPSWKWITAPGLMPQEICNEAEDLSPPVRVELGALTPADTESLIAALLGSRALAVGVLEALQCHSSNLPGRLVTLLDSWLVKGQLVYSDGQWRAPAEQQSELEHRVEAASDELSDLSGEQFALLRLAALLAPAIELSALEHCSGLQTRFFNTLLELERLGLLIRQGTQLRFRRPETARNVLAAWNGPTRRAAHGRAANWLIAATGQAVDEPQRGLADSVAIAGHLSASEDPNSAQQWVSFAVSKCLGIHAVAQAQALLSAD